VILLLDTHVVIWLAGEPTKLSPKAFEAIRDSSEAGGLAISAITLWEVGWLASHGRLDVTGTLESFVARVAARTSIRPITTAIAVLANQFPREYPSDPCDRLIGATALAEGISLVTKDTAICSSSLVKTIW
jgi:PIN domain nuclease of toxin-antitoxin system